MKSENEMEIVQIQDDALGKLLSHIINNYLLRFYTICVLWRDKSRNFEDILSAFLNYSSSSKTDIESNINFAFPNFHLIMVNVSKEYDHIGGGGTTDKAVEQAIELGCQPSGLGNANAQNTNEEKTLLIDGTESILMLEFCTKHNCTLEISRDEAGEWGEIWDNRSGIGVLGAVSEGRADVGISALYEWHHEYQFLDFSAPISRTGITCIVPRPKRLAGWLLPVWPFSWKLWVAVSLAFAVGSVSLLLAKRLYITPKSSRKRAKPPVPAFNNPILIVCRMFLSQSVNIVVKRVPEMVILGCILLIGLMIGNTYSGGLAALMTVPQYEAPIDTPHQLAAKNLEWGATHDAWIFSILLATQPDIVKLLSLFKKSNFEKLRSKAKTGDFAFSIERLPYGSYAIGEYITEDNVEYLQLMPNDIYYEYALAMTTKTWALKPDLDTIILNIAQSGMQKYWENQVVMRYSDRKVQLVVSVSHSESRAKPDPTSLSASQLVGVFIIWLIGIVISSSVFVWERFLTNGMIFELF